MSLLLIQLDLFKVPLLLRENKILLKVLDPTILRACRHPLRSEDPDLTVLAQLLESLHLLQPLVVLTYLFVDLPRSGNDEDLELVTR